MIEGERRLIRKLRKLGSKTAAKKVLRAAANAATTPLRREVKQRTPEDEGELKRSIARETSMKGWNVDSRVGAKRDTVDGKSRPRNLVSLLEFGHANAPAKPFLRPAYDAVKSEMRSKFAAKANEAFTREAEKLKGK